jgi:pilus assembly protein CpaB
VPLRPKPVDSRRRCRAIRISVTAVNKQRIPSAWTPWRRRIRRHRRPIAAALAGLSVLFIIGAVSESGEPTQPVAIAAADIPAGSTLTVDDVTTSQFPVSLVPPGSTSNPSDLDGEILTTAITAGEPITASRLLGSRPDAGRGLVAAPVRLADAGVAGLLAPGDVVDLIAASTDGSARVVARKARLITRPIPPATFGTQTGSLVLLAVTPDEATTIAGVATTRDLSAVLQ